jgi:hypothetical protein
LAISAWDQDHDLAISAYNFDGFLAGDGLFNYIASHKTIRFALHDRSVHERVKEAIRALQTDSLSNLHQCIDSAFACVHEHLQSLDTLDQEEAHMGMLMDRLQLLRDVFHRNVAYFTTRLQSWRE